MSYTYFAAVEYVGDKLLSLDFSMRHFVIEGTGLGELACQLQTASARTVLEFAPDVWSAMPEASAVKKYAPAAAQQCSMSKLERFAKFLLHKSFFVPFHV